MSPSTLEALWQQQLEDLARSHFDAARQRVDDVYGRHFAKLSVIARRHWQHRRDIPRDLANMPRSLWHLGRRLAGKDASEARPLSSKERTIMQIVVEELLAIPQLEKNILDHIQQHPSIDPTAVAQLHLLLERYTPQQAQQRLQQALARLTVSQEGGRDMFVFITLGVLGRSLSDKVAFGSALGLGATAATGIYLGQQSFLAALWTKWFGVPAWVSASGALSGFLVLLLVTPAIAPLTEFGINRIRARVLLHDMIDRVEHNVLHTKLDATSVAGHIGSYMQLLPDFLQLLRSLR
ncbi:hypothetical protein FKG94_24400 [Exilibacterium tricleocarpae]|uniref:Uncharacterized protein n=1 Tax=Exilibacterium tricleocarpae TaxID=2591008 RepID=A0A545SSN1_9GAMM|nr:hypothetical protein FKG94_24400 [Exilibacterium tricleocarpae]